MLFCSSKKLGFTLSELLISLAILGLIAVFAIPKVVQALTEQQLKAAGKEAISTLYSVLFEGWRTGELTQNSTFDNVITYPDNKLSYTSKVAVGGVMTRPAIFYPQELR